MIIESVKKYFESLNSMKEFSNAINVNYLSENIDNFSIEEIPSQPIIKKYANGSTVRQFQFTFCSREIYSMEILQNINNSGFYETLCNEIETNNNNNIFPILENGLESLDLEITSTPYIISVDDNTGIYQVNFRLKYFKEV